MRLGPPNPAWQLVGVDPSADMLAIARSRLAHAALTGRTELVTGVVADLPLEPAFDAATLLLVMHFLPDDGAKRALLTGIAIRLRPGAPLLLADLHGEPGSMGFTRLVNAWKQRILDTGADPTEVATAFDRIEEDVAFVPESRIAELLAEAGFGEPIPFWRGLLFGGWIAYRVSPP